MIKSKRQRVHEEYSQFIQSPPNKAVTRSANTSDHESQSDNLNPSWGNHELVGGHQFSFQQHMQQAHLSEHSVQTDILMSSDVYNQQMLYNRDEDDDDDDGSAHGTTLHHEDSDDAEKGCQSDHLGDSLQEHLSEEQEIIKAVELLQSPKAHSPKPTVPTPVAKESQTYIKAHNYWSLPHASFPITTKTDSSSSRKRCISTVRAPYDTQLDHFLDRIFVKRCVPEIPFEGEGV